MHQINAALHRWLVPDEATPSGSKPTIASHDIIVSERFTFTHRPSLVDVKVTFALSIPTIQTGAIRPHGIERRRCGP